ncbi:TPA: hypothetical protein ACFN8U_001980 [Neisseria meningitidis]
MKVYVFKISNENGKLKIELPEIPMGKQIDEVDLIAGLTTEFIAVCYVMPKKIVANS